MNRGDFPKARAMIGRRYGSLRVLALAGIYTSPLGREHCLVLVRCDCGRERKVVAHQIRDKTRSCRVCSRRQNAQQQRDEASVVLPSGRTLANIAAAAGLKLDTVYHRWIRGWPEKALSEPVGFQRRGVERARGRRGTCYASARA